VGISSVPTGEPGRVTGIIGVHGEVSGFITVNMAEPVARAAVGGLLQDTFDSMSSQVVDGVGEMTNIISGGIKKGLAGSEWGFQHVTVPSVIIGHNYQIAYAGGLQFLCAAFEHQDEASILLDDRLMQVTVSLIRL
jgi:CheY-specific phosphatase CheX